MKRHFYIVLIVTLILAACRTHAFIPNKLAPFGKDVAYSEGDIVRESYLLNFTNKEIDYNLDLHTFGARYYTADFPRFISPDPVSGKLETPITWNRYLYCRNDPINYIDPDGELGILAMAGLAAGAMYLAQAIYPDRAWAPQSKDYYEIAGSFYSSSDTYKPYHFALSITYAKRFVIDGGKSNFTNIPLSSGTCGDQVRYLLQENKVQGTENYELQFHRGIRLNPGTFEFANHAVVIAHPISEPDDEMKLEPFVIDPLRNSVYKLEIFTRLFPTNTYTYIYGQQSEME
jgi:RHS repeat-associated protein